MRHSARAPPVVTYPCLREGDPDMRRLGIALMVVLGWLVLALAFDRLVGAEQCPAYVQLAALQVKLKVPSAEITYPAVSLLVLFVLPILAFAFVMAPWRDLRS